MEIRDAEKGISAFAARRVALFYVVLGSAWILISDVVVYLRGEIGDAAFLVSLVKGLAFVLVTTLALYLFMVRWSRHTLRQSETIAWRLDQFSKHTTDLVLLLDEEGRLLDVNNRALAAYGYPREKLLTMSVGELRCDGCRWEKDWADLHAKGEIRFETRHRRADGSTFPAEVHCYRVVLDGREIAHSFIRDITERKEAERQITRLKDVYAALSQTNQAIARASDRTALFKEICEIAVAFGHFRMAWIGTIDDETQLVSPIAWVGEESHHLEELRVPVTPDSPFSMGPVWRAITTGSPCIINDWAGSEDFAFLPGWILDAQLRSSAAFLLYNKGRIAGVLALYSEDVGFFTSDLVHLLEEMASDISYALDRLDIEEESRCLEQRLRESNARINGIIEAVHDTIATIDSDLRFMLCNRAYIERFEEMFGIAVSPGTPLLSEVKRDKEKQEHFILQWKRALDGEYFFDEWSFVRETDVIYYDSHYGPLLDSSGQRIGAFHVGRDITQRKKMEFEMQKLSMVVEQSPISMVIADLDGNIQYVNAAFTESSGYTAEEAIGQNPRILATGHTSKAEYSELWTRIKNGHPWRGVFYNKRKDGSFYWEDAIIFPVRDPSGQITQFIGIKQDVTKQVEAEEYADFLTHHDALTRLPNRVLGRDRMERAMMLAYRQRGKAALLLVDIDHFKWINDSFGHSVGDSLLQAVAGRIQSCIRAVDTLSRQGGDEFLVVLAGLDDPEIVNRVAAQILERVGEPFAISEHELVVTASIGIAIFPDDGSDFDTLFKRAGSATHYAKESGRNAFRFFTEQMNVDANEYTSILQGLRNALERDEFVLYFQPQINLADRRVLGAEALIRWNHPKEGLMPPGRFIPVAEKSGMIVRIGEWVLREACRQAEAWNSDIGVAVNLSSLQFARGDLLQSVEQALSVSGLDPSRLELELTESILIRETESVLSTVRQLKTLGVKLSIDDFGTGYSSLAYLRRFDLDKLKIDQSFVRNITANHDDDAIVGAIVQMARGLGLRTIAEGVEDETTLEAIRLHGCDEAQGYYFARPMPGPDFARYLAERRQGVSGE